MQYKLLLHQNKQQEIIKKDLHTVTVFWYRDK